MLKGAGGPGSDYRHAVNHQQNLPANRSSAQPKPSTEGGNSLRTASAQNVNYARVEHSSVSVARSNNSDGSISLRLPPNTNRSSLTGNNNADIKPVKKGLFARLTGGLFSSKSSKPGKVFSDHTNLSKSGRKYYSSINFNSKKDGRSLDASITGYKTSDYKDVNYTLRNPGKQVFANH